MTSAPNVRPPALYARALGLFRNARDRDYFHLLAAQFSTQFLAMGTILIVAKMLSAEEFGAIKILQSYALVFAVVGEFGMGTALLKLCSEDREERERRGILKAVLLRTLVTATASVAALAGLVVAGVAAADPRMRPWLLVLALGIPFSVATSVLTQFLQALKKIREMAKAQVAIRAQLSLLVVGATWLWGFRGFIVATAIGLAAGLWPLTRHVRLVDVLREKASLPSSFAGMAGFSVLSTLLVVVGQNGDLLVLDHFSSSRVEIGYYSLAAILVQGAWLVVHSAGVIAVPYFSERSSDRVWVRRTLLRTQAQATAVSVVVGALIFAAAWFFVPRVYGEPYRAVLSYLGVLLMKNVVVSSYTITRMALVGVGRMDCNFVAFLITTPVGLGLTYVMLRRHGVVGVAWAQGAAALLTLALLSLTALHILRDRGRPAREARPPLTKPAE